MGIRDRHGPRTGIQHLDAARRIAVHRHALRGEHPCGGDLQSISGERRITVAGERAILAPHFLHTPQVRPGTVIPRLLTPVAGIAKRSVHTGDPFFGLHVFATLNPVGVVSLPHQHVILIEGSRARAEIKRARYFARCECSIVVGLTPLHRHSTPGGREAHRERAREHPTALRIILIVHLGSC